MSRVRIAIVGPPGVIAQFEQVGPTDRDDATAELPVATVDTGIVSDQFGRERDQALGLFTSVLPIGGIVGPILGGVGVSVRSWRGIFLVNVPIGATLAVVALVLVPPSEGRLGTHLKVIGVAHLAGCLLFRVTLFGSGSALDRAVFVVPLAVSPEPRSYSSDAPYRPPTLSSLSRCCATGAWR